ncbi:hypothetical protein BGX30_006735, partial [Mortierella sp. GBA39]
MTDNRLSLFCLVDGEATANAFSVKIPSNDTVDDLKELIKTKKSPEFDDIAADKLTLWRVSIPDDDDDDEVPILLDSVSTEDKKKLRATRELSEVFTDKLPKSTIHIIVQRPPQEYDLLQFVPSPAIGEEQVASTLTEPSMSVPPRSVTPWPGFLES